ncbi:MAG: response regulator [Candidatus Sungbacteria bacterium]|nr:response regulator [Candidatus Sungbacteria bacterium]
MENLTENNPIILLVEDDKFLRNIISQKLTQAGFRVEEAVDGKEALKKVESKAPKLVLLDLLLPEIDGFAVLKRLQENNDLKKIPVIVLSNLGQDEDVRKAKELGAKDYMVKAYFTPTEVIERVQKILREVYF